ncbi:nuclear pore complex protein Nup160-like [Centruroides sculpturatus]|uniref:nuclear pore complex protein Nup160-like n=1 Tax=Centruroides sculpturatus TaxID=218467 RepID=UPI000C6CF637|nr:nuclear pore complex protein Nup160-like [Centruroides sculpturatus]
MGAVQYIEVQPYPESYGGEKDLTVNAEAAQSTLQDIKLPESAGGYAYQESCFLSTPTSNRYIYWRASNEILELIEVSLDVNLTGSHIRLRFQHTPVLEGVSIHETHDQVIILVATISSVHRLVFPHPRKLIGTDYLSFHPSEATLPSIFFDASLATLQDSKNHYVLNHAASVGVPLPHTSCSWLTPQKDAIFVLANSIGTLLVVCLPQDKEKVIAFELKQTSVMSRIISGLVPSVIRGNQVREDMAYSLVCHPFNGDTLIFALCKDFRIRMWSYQRRECLMDANVLECCGDRIINTPLNLTAQQFSMKKVSGYRDQDFFLAVYMSLPEQNQFFIFQSRIFSGQCNLAYISTLYAPEYDLVDFHLTDSQLWTLWLNGNSEPIVKFTFIDSEENQCKDVSWTLVHLQTPIYRRIADTSIASDYQSSLTTLKEEVTHAVETEIRSRASEGELTDEEFIDLQMECWHKFFSYCLQYHENNSEIDPKIKRLFLIFLNNNTYIYLHLTSLSMSFLNSKIFLKHTAFIPGSLVHLFLREQGGIQVRQLLGLLQPAEDRMQSAWNNLLPSLVNIVAQLIWPNGMNFLFPEFLLVQCQYLPLQEYVRLLQHWCEWNTCSYQFLVANCHLCLGEPQKAFDLFCQAAEGINNELFLHNKLIQGIEQTSSSSLIVQYYLKVIQLFEFFKQPEYIILLADTAINVIEPEDPSIPVFWSLIFKYHLELNHNEEAYTAMIGNPDPIRRKDSLRQFIVVLCERRELQSLIEFSYADLKNDVVNILESRARSTDLLTQNYYSILYAFHIHNNNFRKAASIMYEHALRLSREVFGRESLVKQAQCYLAVLNCLRLIDQQYAWIVKPIPTVTDNKDEPINVSPKRNFDGERIPQSGTTKMEVLEIEDIKHEYDLVHARLKLLQNDSSPTNIAASLLSPGETVTLLVNSGFYDAAIHICQSFNLSYVPVFDGIAEKCLELMHQYNQQVLCEAWEWLGENELPSVQTTSADKYLWYLLKYYLNKYEKSNQSIYHRCVVSKLLAEGSHLPIWLKLSYQRRNFPELLWLYISCDMLEDATQLAIEYIDAVRGVGKEYFGLKYALHGMNPPVWLPYTLLDMLLNSLEENQEDEVYNELCQKLKDKLCEYQAELGYASKATVELSSRKTL